MGKSTYQSMIPASFKYGAYARYRKLNIYDRDTDSEMPDEMDDLTYQMQITVSHPYFNDEMLVYYAYPDHVAQAGYTNGGGSGNICRYLESGYGSRARLDVAGKFALVATEIGNILDLSEGEEAPGLIYKMTYPAAALWVPGMDLLEVPKWGPEFSVEVPGNTPEKERVQKIEDMKSLWNAFEKDAQRFGKRIHGMNPKITQAERDAAWQERTKDLWKPPQNN